MSVLKELNWLCKATATADDKALQRVVQTLDQVKDRGQADKILELARQRLRALRPPRPLGFTRLLFVPLDGAIVPSARWRRGEPQVPRSALAALSAAVHAGLGPEAAGLLKSTEGRTTADHVVVTDVGGRLWPAAANALPASPPPGWEDTGLAAADYGTLAELCRPVWANGPAIWGAMAAAGAGPPEELVRAALLPLVQEGPKAIAAGLASLSLRAQNPGQLATFASRLHGSARIAAQQVLDTLLDEPLPPMDSMDVHSLAREAQALLHRYEDLENCPLMGTDRQRRLAAVRRHADEACRDRFLNAMEVQVIGPAAILAQSEKVSDEDAATLEAGARQLRLLESIGRRLGSPGSYDRALAALGEALTGLAGRCGQAEGLTPMDLARTMEILCGAEAAGTLLQLAQPTRH